MLTPIFVFTNARDPRYEYHVWDGKCEHHTSPTDFDHSSNNALCVCVKKVATTESDAAQVAAINAEAGESVNAALGQSSSHEQRPTPVAVWVWGVLACAGVGSAFLMLVVTQIAMRRRSERSSACAGRTSASRTSAGTSDDESYDHVLDWDTWGCILSDTQCGPLDQEPVEPKRHVHVRRV
jgi:hypothetical protein